MANGTFNQQIVIGNLGAAPHMFRDSQGERKTVIANFSLATTERWKSKTGEQQEETTWHRCVAFGRAAEIVEQYANTGDKLHVVGRTRTRKYRTDAGGDAYITEVVVQQLNLLGKPTKNAEAAAQSESGSGDGADFESAENPFFVPQPQTAGA